MHEQEVSNCISGLGRLGAEWSELSATIRRSLGDAFVCTIGEDDLPPRGLAMSVHGLGRMNANFASLPSNFRTNMMSAIHKISPLINSLEVSNILYGLGKMGTCFSMDEVNEGKEAAAKVVSSSSSRNKVPFAIPGLVMKGVSSEELDLSIAGQGRATPSPRTGSPGRGFKADCEVVMGMSRKARESLLDAFTREAWQMNAQGVANSLWGLMLMDSYWWILSPTLQSTALKVVNREVSRMTEQELCNTIYALGRLGLRWTDLPSEARESILLAVEERSLVMAPPGVVMTLLGLGRMGLLWEEMSVPLVTALNSCIERVLQSTSERTLSGLIHALATVGVQWQDLSPRLQSAVLTGISRGEKESEEKQIVKQIAPPVSTKAPPASPKTGRSPERASRAAFGASAILTIKTIRNWSPSTLIVKTAPAPASTWSRSNQTDPKSKLLSTTSLLNQKSSKAAAAMLLSPSAPLGPTALVAIQSMISPPNFDMHSFKALIDSQLASPVVENTQSSQTQPKRLPSQPVAANELEFYKTVASTPKSTSPNSVKSKDSAGVLPKGKSKVDSSKSDIKKIKQTEVSENRRPSILKTSGEIGVPIMNAAVAVAQKDEVKTPASVNSLVSQVTSTSPSSVIGNHLVYSLGKIGVSWAQLGEETRTTLSDSLVLSLPLMGEMGVVNSLHGLTGLDAKWKELRSDVQTAFQIALQRVSPEMGEQGVSVTILSLAKLDVVWSDDLHEDVKKALKVATARQSHIGEHALSSLLYGLGKLGRTWSGIATDVRQTLKEAIVTCHLNDRCTPQGVANSLHGLAQMQAGWGDFSSSVKLALFAESTKAVPSATETQLSNILGSLGKMGLQWEALPDQLKVRVINALILKSATFNEWHLSTLLFSLGSMGLSWKNLPTNLRNSFIASLLRVNTVRDKLTNSQSSAKHNSPSAGVSKTNKKNWEPKNVDLDDYDELLTVVDYIIRKEDTGVQRIKDNDDTGRILKSSAEKEKQLQLNAQGVSMTVVGMSRLAATYGLLSDSVIHSISMSLRGALSSMNCAQVAASVSGLSKAQWRWDALSEELKEDLHAAITRTAPKATSLDMALLVNGLGTMGARWVALPANTRTSLQVGIKRTAIRGVADEVAGVTFGLALMEVSLSILPHDTRLSLQNGILRVCGVKTDSTSSSTKMSQRTSSAMNSAASDTSRLTSSTEGQIFDFSWLMTATDSKTRVSKGHPHVEQPPTQQMSPQALANLMYAISLMIFEESVEVHEELTQVHIALLDSISLIGVGSGQFSEAEKEQILIYISTVQTLTPLGRSVKSRPRCILRADKPFTKPSKLQQSVVSALTSALRDKSSDFEVEDEYSAFSGAFPVDATIFEGDKPVAFVEVNGPQHYRADGRLRRKDLIKEALYRGKYPDASFTRVRFDQVNRLGSSYVGAQVAQFISNSPPVRVLCTAAAGVSTSFFPLFSPSTSPDACRVLYKDCEEDALAVRRAERELVKALSKESNQDQSVWAPMYNNIHSHAYYLSQAKTDWTWNSN